MSRTILAVLAVTLFTVTCWSFGARPTSRFQHVGFTPDAATSESPAALSGDASLERPSMPTPGGPDTDEQWYDLYGNDVSDAVAKYKSDRSGGVYEEHSPETEVPRLKSPTT